jgi:hypothetical protein
MLAQNFQRKDAKTLRRKIRIKVITFDLVFAALCLGVFALSLNSCSSKPTDMRVLVPAEALIYLETNDLAAALQPMIDSRQFKDAAVSKPDLSPMKGVQVAVAVLGFELSEEKVSEEQSIGNVQPRFVVIADTHAWNYQAVAFAEQKLGDFVENIYGSEPTLETSDKHGGKYFTWSAEDGRKAHALVIDSVIWFANDERPIEKSLAVRRGESANIIGGGKVTPAEQGTLARGFVSADGIGQIASLAAMKIATDAGEESEVRTAVMVILPELIRSSATELAWTSFRADSGFEDRFTAGLPQDSTAGQNELIAELVDSFFEGIEQTTGEDVAIVIAERRPDAPSSPNKLHRREDHFTANSAERRITSDLGFIGWLVARLAQD